MSSRKGTFAGVFRIVLGIFLIGPVTVAAIIGVVPLWQVIGIPIGLTCIAAGVRRLDRASEARQALEADRDREGGSRN
jgi:hypothetical protein